jgi:hypothetical protein
VNPDIARTADRADEAVMSHQALELLVYWLPRLSDAAAHVITIASVTKLLIQAVCEVTKANGELN